MVKISVLIGVYNGEKGLARALDSILQQTFQDFEIIICDDKSSDNSRLIIEKYAELYPNRIKTIFNQENLSLAGALNKCLEISSGEYIARMDQDDICISTRFQRQVNILNENRLIDCVGSYMRIKNMTFNDGLRKIITKPSLKELIKGGYAFYHPTIMIRRNILLSLNGYRNVIDCNLCEDLDLWYRFFINGFKGTNIETPLLIYSESSNDFRKRKFKRAWTVFKLRNYYRKICKKNILYNIFYLKSLLFSMLPYNIKYFITNIVRI